MSLPPSTPAKFRTPPPNQPLHAPGVSAASSVSHFDPSLRRHNMQAGGALNGAGASGAPRRAQNARKQHRNQKRPGTGTGTGTGTGSVSGYRAFPDEDDDMAELRALKNSANRRGQTSITHLLDYAEPTHAYLGSHGAGPSYRSRHSGGSGSHAHGTSHRHHHGATPDKARYVHANYRFVVSPHGRYGAQMANADEYIDWDDVLQVIASSESQGASCPICLSEPVAPRMAKCGHIFCLPCLIRFMHAIDADDTSAAAAGVHGRSVPGMYSAPRNNTMTQPVSVSVASAPGVGTTERRAKWKRCPICEESVYLRQVRPVRFYAGQESRLPRPGDDVVLRLMTRHAKSIVALPLESQGQTSTQTNGRIPWHFAANVLDYARIMRGTSDYMADELSREVVDLERQQKEDELMFQEDGEWTKRAIRLVRAEKEAAAALTSVDAALQDTAMSEEENQARHLPVGAEAVETTAPRTAVPAPTNTSTGSPSDQSKDPDFFFYMSPPHLYLSPLDIRILKTSYGSFASFPSTLLPRVEHVSTGHVVDDAMRRRAKYLAHLPAGCDVSFLECDWTDIVAPDILAAFAKDIERRRKANRDKANHEERERLEAERLEAAALHRGPRRIIPSATVTDAERPAVDLDEFVPLGYEEDPVSAEPGPLPPAHEHGSRTVWGTRVVVSPMQDNDNKSQDVDDGWLIPDAVLDHPNGFGGHDNDNDRADAVAEALGADHAASTANDAALAAQLAAASLHEYEADEPKGKGGAGGKRKKKQKITLMSTVGRRGL